MNDTYIQDQDVAPVDQPAELEGIRLNWSQSRFVRTRSGPYDLRTAPATPEFWEVWNRNKGALKDAGISCVPASSGDWLVEWWIDVSDDVTDATPVDDIQIPEDESDTLRSAYVTPVDDIQISEDESDTLSSSNVTPVDNICIPEDKSYTLSEVIDLVKQTLDGVSEQSAQDELRYSSRDVYWLLHDMLRYVSQNVSDVFVLRQIRKDTYRVKHMREDYAKQRAGRKLKAEVNRTANYLEELTGKRPAWGEDE